MKHQTLGEALFYVGFRRSRWYPGNAFSTNPPLVTGGEFRPAKLTVNQRYGNEVEGPLLAKGSLPGFWHGREILPDEDWIRDTLSLRDDWSFRVDLVAKEDLKYVCDADGNPAYSWLIAEWGEAPPPRAVVASKLSAPDVRAEELRSLILGMKLPDPVHELFQSEASWVNMKVFVVAAINLYRKVMLS